MSMEDLAATALAVLMPEVAKKMEQTITIADWCAVEAGEIGLRFDLHLRGHTVEVTCNLERSSGGNQLFIVTRTLAPAAQA